MDVKTFTKLISTSNIILLGKPSLRYFGILSCGIEKTFFTPDSPIFNMLPSYAKNALAWTDGKTMSFVARDRVTTEELNFDILHELFHIIMGHIKRKGDRDPETWNIATDHVVNRNIMIIALRLESNRKGEKFDNSLTILDVKGRIGNKIYVPDDIVFLKDIHKQFPEATAEQIYYLLEEEDKRVQKTQTNAQKKKGKEKGDLGGEMAGGDGGEKQGLSDGSEIQENSGGSTTPSNYSDGGQPGPNDGSGQEQNHNGTRRFKKTSENVTLPDGSVVKVNSVVDSKTGDKYTFAGDTEVDTNTDLSECNEIQDKAKALWHSKNQIVGKGDYPGDFVSFMDEMFKIEVPWDTLCESALLYPIQASRGRTWSMPNFYYRRFAKVPGKRIRSLQKKLFVVLIDSSGSISDNDLSIFTGIVLDSIKHFDGLVVLVHDVKVQQEFYFEKKPNEERVFEEIREIKGRGGTSHQPVFDRVQELHDSGDSISIVMALTDYESDVQHIYDNYSWILNIPMVWAITASHVVDLPGTDFNQINIPPDIREIGVLEHG